MIEKENNKHLTIINSDAKNEIFREKLKNIVPLIIEIKTKKVKILKTQLKHLKMMKTMNLKT